MSYNWIICYVITHILTYVLIIHVFGKGHLRIKDDPEMHKRFYPFMRKDLHKWSVVWNFPYYITFWPRLVICFSSVAIYTAVITIFMIGVNI